MGVAYNWLIVKRPLKSTYPATWVTVYHITKLVQTLEDYKSKKSKL